MSLFVLLIALLHGVPVLVVGMSTRSVASLAWTALICAAVGVFTGNPIYIVLDLIGVAIGFRLGWRIVIARLRRERAAAPTPPPPVAISIPAPAPASALSGVGTAVLIVAVGAAIVYSLSNHTATPRTTSAASYSPPAPVAAPVVAAPTPKPPARAAAPASNAPFTNVVAAARAGALDDLDRLVRTGASINGPVAGVTPLIAAVRAGRHGNVRFLLSAGANPNLPDAQGNFALTYAQARNDTSMVALLQDYGATR